MQYKITAVDLKFGTTPAEDEIKARAAAYAARPDVQARWAADARLIARTKADLAVRTA